VKALIHTGRENGIELGVLQAVEAANERQKHVLVEKIVARYGYMESPDVSDLMEKIRALGVPINPEGATYFFNREMIISGGNAQMWEWQKSLYALLSRNARPAKDYYRITPSQIIEIGLPLQL
jgi:KUP system potassium uptake protein